MRSVIWLQDLRVMQRENFTRGHQVEYYDNNAAGGGREVSNAREALSASASNRGIQ